MLWRVRGNQQQALLAHLHQFLFEEQGFAGNSNDYYNPFNSYLPALLQTKLGLPISLSLIYKLVAERLGLSGEAKKRFVERHRRFLTETAVPRKRSSGFSQSSKKTTFMSGRTRAERPCSWI